MPSRKNFPGRKQQRTEQALQRHNGIPTDQALMNGDKAVYQTAKKARR